VVKFGGFGIFEMESEAFIVGHLRRVLPEKSHAFKETESSSKSLLLDGNP
jgi:hypothetical protein